MNLSELINSTRILNTVYPLWMIPMLLMVLAHFLSEPMRWNLFLRQKSISAYAKLFHSFSITAILTYLVPLKLGVPVRLYLLKRSFPLRLSEISTYMIVDSIIYYMAWGSVALIAVFVVFKQYIGIGWSIISVAGMAAVIYGVIKIGYKHIVKLPGRIGQVIAKLQQANSGTIKNLVSSLNVKVLAAILFVIFIDIVSHIYRHEFILSSIGVQVPSGVLFAIVPIAIFSGMASMMPMGLGGYDIVLVLLLKEAGLSAEQAVSVAVINRLASFVVAAVLGSYSGARLGINVLSKKSLKNIAEDE